VVTKEPIHFGLMSMVTVRQICSVMIMQEDTGSIFHLETESSSIWEMSCLTFVVTIKPVHFMLMSMVMVWQTLSVLTIEEGTISNFKMGWATSKT